MTGGQNENPGARAAQPGLGNRSAEAAGNLTLTQAKGRAKRCGVILATLDEIDEAISVFQERCEGDGAWTAKIAHPDPTVTVIRDTVKVPGQTWQTLETLRHLNWAVRKLVEEIGGAHD